MKEVIVERSPQTEALFLLKGLDLLDEITICGSYGLKINGILNRKIHDLDLLTDHDWYGWNPFRETALKDSGSHKFNVAGQDIRCTKIYIAGCNVDLLYSSQKTEYKTVKLIVNLEGSNEKNMHTPGNRELIVRVELPEVAIKFKQQYMKNDRSEESRKKHKLDLERMGVNS